MASPRHAWNVLEWSLIKNDQKLLHFLSFVAIWCCDLDLGTSWDVLVAHDVEPELEFCDL